jgi:hypothetical protein
MESKLCNEEIIDMNTAKVKIEIDDFDFCEKEHVLDEVISNEPSFIAQKRKNTENENHEIMNQKKYKGGLCFQLTRKGYQSGQNCSKTVHLFQ